MSAQLDDLDLLIDRERHIFKVPRKAFVSEDVLKLERESIFDTCWLYLGHASELNKPGDFVTRTVGGRNILFNKDASGKVNAFLNTCPHRGATVCRDRNGNSKSFQCFYHGWIFGADGTLKSQPGQASYSERFNEDGGADLKSVARLDHYKGFYFLCYDPNAISLHDYLAGAREYLDLVADQSVGGMSLVGGTQEYSARANWKLLAENSIDGYHAATTHASYLDYLKSVAGALAGAPLNGVGKDLGNGHAVIEYTGPWGRPIAQWIPIWGEEGKRELDAKHSELVARFGEETATRIAKNNRNLLIFPNLIINDIMAITIRTFYPVAPGYLHVNAWAVAPSDENEWARKFRLNNFLEFLGPGGFATPDDVEALEQCQKGFENSRETLWNDISKGMSRETPAMDDEIQMRAFWTEWHARITARARTAMAAE